MTNKKPTIEELVKATLIIGARRANNDLIHKTALPLIEKSIKGMSERFKQAYDPTQQSTVTDEEIEKAIQEEFRYKGNDKWDRGCINRLNQSKYGALWLAKWLRSQQKAGSELPKDIDKFYKWATRRCSNDGNGNWNLIDNGASYFYSTQTLYEEFKKRNPLPPTT